MASAPFSAKLGVSHSPSGRSELDRMDRTTARRIATAVLSILVLSLSAPAAQAQTKPLTPVSLRTDIFINGSHIPLLVGVVDGIYKKYGLDVTIAPGQGSATTIQTVA